MKMMKLALAIACAVASTSATASAVEASKGASSNVSTCYHEYTVITAEGDVYYVYTCYSNGDGSY